MALYSMDARIDTSELKLLVEHPSDPVATARIETFAVPTGGLDEVRITGTELVCRCPVNRQTDVYDFTIAYRPRPGGRCVETKSLKYYLMSFRDRAEFAEALAVRVMGDVVAALSRDASGAPATPPSTLSVELVQAVRGGMRITARATYADPTIEGES